MLTENLVIATLATNKPSAHLSSVLKDVGVFCYEFQPQTTFRQGFKKSSIYPQCLAIGDRHIYAAQADKAVIHVYNREKGNQEATVPFPDKIKSITYADKACVLVIGTEDGRLILWEVATGRISTSSSSHLQAVSHLVISQDNDTIVSGSADSNVYVWSLSQLLSISHTTPTYDPSKSQRSYLNAFVNHRSSITALALGHSGTSTNFSVSVSADQTCYIWHTQTCQVLRTLLLPASAICATIDPADRAIYFGCDSGNIQQVDLFSELTGTSRSSIFNDKTTAIQIPSDGMWVAPTESGPVRSVALSYDGTSLLSGHYDGKIIRWDVAKHRVVSEIAALNQPISHLEMLLPIGLISQTASIIVPAVVKPRLEFSLGSEKSLSNIPAGYTLQTQIIRSNASRYGATTHRCTNLTNPGFDSSSIQDGLRAIALGLQPIKKVAEAKDRDLESESEMFKILEENATLKARMNAISQAEGERRKRHLSRQKQREACKIQKVEAFATARRKGRDTEVAMRPFEEAERILDIESEEDYPNDLRMDIEH